MIIWATPTPPQYIDWGIPTINDTVQVAAGDYMIIGADSSVGKTAIMLQLALNAAKSGKRVCIFSLETTERKLLMRSVAQNTGVNFQAMKNKRLSKDDYSRIMDYGEKTSRLVCDVAEASGRDYRRYPRRSRCEPIRHRHAGLSANRQR